MTLQIDILNPKAIILLKNIPDLNLIFIRDEKESYLIKVVAKLRKKASSESLKLEMITNEVELVRT